MNTFVFDWDLRGKLPLDPLLPRSFLRTPQTQNNPFSPASTRLRSGPAAGYAGGAAELLKGNRRRGSAGTPRLLLLLPFVPSRPPYLPARNMPHFYERNASLHT